MKSDKLKLFEGTPHNAIRSDLRPIKKTIRPKGLSNNARLLWQRLVPQLEAMALATAIDQASLIGLCEWWSTYCKAQEGLKMVDDYGSIEGARALAAVKTSWSEFRRMAELFGLSPNSRSGIHVEQPKEDGLDELKI